MAINRHGKSPQTESDDAHVTSAAIEMETREVAGQRHPRVVERVDFPHHVRHFVKLAKRGPHQDASPVEIAANWIAKSMQDNLYPRSERRDSQLALNQA